MIRVNILCNSHRAKKERRSPFLPIMRSTINNDNLTDILDLYKVSTLFLLLFFCSHDNCAQRNLFKLAMSERVTVRAGVNFPSKIFFSFTTNNSHDNFFIFSITIPCCLYQLIPPHPRIVHIISSIFSQINTIVVVIQRQNKSRRERRRRRRVAEKTNFHFD